MLNNQEVREQTYLAVLCGLKSRRDLTLPPQTIASHAMKIANAFITVMSTYGQGGGAPNDIHWIQRVYRAGLSSLEGSCRQVDVGTLDDPSPTPGETNVQYLAHTSYEQGEFLLYNVDNGIPAP